MIEPLAASISTATTGSPSALGVAFLAGTLTSIGPCVAPRYIALAAIANGYRRPIVPTGAFIAGLIGAYLALGWSAGLLGSIWSISTWIDGILAVTLIGSGCITVVRAVPAHACVSTHAISDLELATVATPRRSIGAVFLLGAASALVISPCCTPIVASVVATSAAIGKPLLGTMLVVSFACGHAAPLFVLGGIAGVTRNRMLHRIPAQVPAIVTGTLMLTLGVYYGLLV